MQKQPFLLACNDLGAFVFLGDQSGSERSFRNAGHRFHFQNHCLPAV
jgi:hypothetical protein